LKVHAEKVAKADIQPLLTGLFEVADEIDVEADRDKVFGMVRNELRLHWLLRSLVRDRLSLEERSAVYMAACQSASLGWLANFADSAWADYHPREGKEPQPEEKCLTTAADALCLRAIYRDRVAEEAETGALLEHADLAKLLYRWCEVAEDDGAAVREWTSRQLTTDEGVRRFAVAFTGYGWIQGLGELGDLVARRTTGAQVKGLDRLMDVTELRRRAEEVVERLPEVATFLDAWKRQERGRD
jgi:hypothetical protein